MCDKLPVISHQRCGMSLLRIGLLGSIVQDAYGGVNYVLNLIRALAVLPADQRPRLTLFVDFDAPNAAAFESVRPLVEKFAALPGLTSPGLSPVRRLARIVARLTGTWGQDVIRAGQRAGCEALFPTSISLGPPRAGAPAWMGWAYDLQHVHYPDFFTKADLQRRDFYFAGLAREAPHIVVSSQAARGDWLGLFPHTAPRVSVLSFTSVPLNEWYAGSPEEVVARYGLPPKFLLLPNQFWIHKNHLTAFEAVRRLRDSGLPVHLVCTGATRDRRHPDHFDRLQQHIQQNKLSDNIRVLGLVPAGDQIQLIRAAAAIVQPSLFEGWSTVVEEARALGKTIFLSDLSVHREQNVPDSHFFHPTDSAALAGLIAAAWPSLAPGPQVAREATARADHTGRVQGYAKTFMKTVQTTLAAAVEPR
jgi:glycosyltransferase involved in cell wall biosynthesis